MGVDGDEGDGAERRGHTEMTIAEAQARLREATRWFVMLRERQAVGILDPPEVEARLVAELRVAGQAVRAAETGAPEVVAAPRAAMRADVDARQIEIAEQMHRAAVRAARHRKAAAVNEARARAGRAAVRREAKQARLEQARAWVTQQEAEAAARAGRHEVDPLQRRPDVRETYAVNFRETYADDAYYIDAIESFNLPRVRRAPGWR